MIIILKNNESLICNEFNFRCSIGKKGKTKNKLEGDKKTPKGTFKLGDLYYSADRKSKPQTKLNCIKITKNMGWCDDVRSKDYNKLIRINKNFKFRYETLFRKDRIYDFFIVINYNTKKTLKNKGSAIFLHLTYNYKKTLGCVATSEKDFLILAKIINKNTKIKII